jgi:hypothetical protein
MSSIDKNIETITKAARGCETMLLHSENTPEEIVAECKLLVEYINAANLLQQIKSAQKSNPKESKIITM